MNNISVFMELITWERRHLACKIAQRSKWNFISIVLARQAALAGKMPALPGRAIAFFNAIFLDYLNS